MSSPEAWGGTGDERVHRVVSTKDAAFKKGAGVRENLTCASPGCRFRVHSKPVFRGYCCRSCELSSAHGGQIQHGPACERVLAPMGADRASGGGVHHGFTCDGCGRSPIVGTRYRSLEWPDYDLCVSCHDRADRESICTGCPKPNHKFEAALPSPFWGWASLPVLHELESLGLATGDGWCGHKSRWHRSGRDCSQGWRRSWGRSWGRDGSNASWKGWRKGWGKDWRQECADTWITEGGSATADGSGGSKEGRWDLWRVGQSQSAAWRWTEPSAPNPQTAHSSLAIAALLAHSDPEVREAAEAALEAARAAQALQAPPLVADQSA